MTFSVNNSEPSLWIKITILNKSVINQLPKCSYHLLYMKLIWTSLVFSESWYPLVWQLPCWGIQLTLLSLDMFTLASNVDTKWTLTNLQQREQDLGLKGLILLRRVFVSKRNTWKFGYFHILIIQIVCTIKPVKHEKLENCSIWCQDIDVFYCWRYV